jgi:hypothetical protein
VRWCAPGALVTARWRPELLGVRRRSLRTGGRLAATGRHLVVAGLRAHRELRSRTRAPGVLGVRRRSLRTGGECTSEPICYNGAQSFYAANIMSLTLSDVSLFTKRSIYTMLQAGRLNPDNQRNANNATFLAEPLEELNETHNTSYTRAVVVLAGMNNVLNVVDVYMKAHESLLYYPFYNWAEYGATYVFIAY